jgi:glycine cleavage system pyridoxal-binding protein P
MLESHEDFKNRHIGPTADDQQAMLSYLGYDSTESLMAAAEGYSF